MIQRTLFCALASIALLQGQTSTGEIDVAVSDASDAVITGARVTVTGSDTGAVARTILTNSSGLAAIPLLQVGTYDVKVEKEGFKTLIRKGVVIQVTEVVSLRLALEVGATTQSVTIAESAPLVDTTTNTEGQVVGNQTMEQLPLNGRNYLQLAILTAGTVPSTNKDQSFSRLRESRHAERIPARWRPERIVHSRHRQSSAGRDAAVARCGGRVQGPDQQLFGRVRLVGGRGGDGSDQERHEPDSRVGVRLSAKPRHRRQRLLRAARAEAPPLVYNLFGGSLGGDPIKKNRAWLFGAYQGTQIHPVHDPDFRRADLGEQEWSLCPDHLRSQHHGRVRRANFVRTPFPNNTIPASEMNFGQQDGWSRSYPIPDLSGANNFQYSALQTTGLNTATFRGDVQVSSKDTMFGRFSFNQGTIDIQSGASGAGGSPRYWNICRAWNAGYGWTRVFSPTLVNEFRASWAEPWVKKDGTLPLNPIIPNSLAPGVDSAIPVFNITGYAGLGQNPAGFGINTPLAKSSDVYEVSDSATKSLGAHLLKFGYTHQYVHMYTLTTLTGRGAFTFDGSYTQNPQSRTGTGSALADVELGLAQTVVTSTIGVSNLRANNDFWYVQDDWKATQRLTLNFGLRYELYWPLYDTQNKYSNFVTDPTNPNFGHMVFAGLNGQSRSLETVDPHNFAPRFGFAYRVPHAGDMVIRGGYGIFYGNPDEQTGVGAMDTNNPPFVGVGGQNIIGDRNNPFYRVQPQQQPAAVSGSHQPAELRAQPQRYRESV